MLTMNSKNVSTNLNNSFDTKLTYTFLEPQTNVLSTNTNTINEYKKIDQEYPQMKEILNKVLTFCQNEDTIKCSGR